MKMILVCLLFICAPALSQPYGVSPLVDEPNNPGTYGAQVWNSKSVMQPLFKLTESATVSSSFVWSPTPFKALITVSADGKIKIYADIPTLKKFGKENYQAKAYADMAIEILRLRGELAKAKQQADAELSKP